MLNITGGNVPRIGVDKSTVTWLQQNGYPDLKLKDVEEEHYARDAQSRTKDDYLWDKRIEIDAILAQVGGEGLWKYFMHQITTISPIRDYTDIIVKPEIGNLYSPNVSLALAKVEGFTNEFIEDEWKKIQDEFKEVRGELLKPEQKEEDIKVRLKQKVEDHKEEIIRKFIEEFSTIIGDSDSDNKNQSNQRGQTN